MKCFTILKEIINIKNYKMKEITFKAETSEELFFMIEDFLKGYELNNGKFSLIKSKSLP